jgi:hypothetical protein
LQQLRRESAMKPADLPLQHALACFLLADELPTPHKREVLRELAMQWLRLAERQENYWRHAAPAGRDGRQAVH